MRTTVLERIEKKTLELEQREARRLQEAARLKGVVKQARTAIIRAAGLFDLDPKDLQQELLLSKSLRDHAAEHKLDVAEFHREILAFVRRPKKAPRGWDKVETSVEDSEAREAAE